jgi:predicted lipid-binding transport protein (Tim44 family)
MSQKSSWNERIALSLRVGAIVTVLGFVVLAAEQRLAQVVSPQEIIAAETAPNFAPGNVAPAPAKAAEQRAAPKDSDDYFPSHFPEPKGEPETQPDTF